MLFLKFQSKYKDNNSETIFCIWKLQSNEGESKAEDIVPWQTNITSSKGKISNPSILFQLQQHMEHGQGLSKISSEESEVDNGMTWWQNKEKLPLKVEQSICMTTGTHLKQGKKL